MINRKNFRNRTPCASWESVQSMLTQLGFIQDPFEPDVFMRQDITVCIYCCRQSDHILIGPIPVIKNGSFYRNIESVRQIPEFIHEFKKAAEARRCADFHD